MADLFGYKKPRAKPRKLMKVVDAGNLPNGRRGVQFVCPHCEHDTGWIEDRWPFTENMKGQPCPKCNEGVPEYAKPVIWQVQAGVQAC